MTDIQQHFTSGTSLNNDDLLIISISSVPIFAIAQTLDDIGMGGSIDSVLTQYSQQIAFEILQKLISVSLNLAVQAATTRTNNDTQQTQCCTFCAVDGGLICNKHNLASLHPPHHYISS